uniref:Uncharacterized protein n=1 Tax=Oryza glumipatula TaxID=40148 RepID=A0A0D9ZD07_9ORYZ
MPKKMVVNSHAKATRERHYIVEAERCRDCLESAKEEYWARGRELQVPRSAPQGGGCRVAHQGCLLQCRQAPPRSSLPSLHAREAEMGNMGEGGDGSKHWSWLPGLELEETESRPCLGIAAVVVDSSIASPPPIAPTISREHGRRQLLEADGRGSPATALLNVVSPKLW